MNVFSRHLSWHKRRSKRDYSIPATSGSMCETTYLMLNKIAFVTGFILARRAVIDLCGLAEHLPDTTNKIAIMFYVHSTIPNAVQTTVRNKNNFQ